MVSRIEWRRGLGGYFHIFMTATAKERGFFAITGDRSPNLFSKFLSDFFLYLLHNHPPWRWLLPPTSLGRPTVYTSPLTRSHCQMLSFSSSSITETGICIKCPMSPMFALEARLSQLEEWLCSFEFRNSPLPSRVRVSGWSGAFVC